MRTGFMGSIVVGIAALAVTSGVLAQSAARSGVASTTAVAVRPSSARTSTASSR